MIELAFLGFSAHATGELAVCAAALIAIVFLALQVLLFLKWYRSGAKPRA